MFAPVLLSINSVPKVFPRVQPSTGADAVNC